MLLAYIKTKKLFKIFTTLTLISWLIFFLGPFEYKIYNYEGLFYHMFANFLFALSLLIPVNVSKGKNVCFDVYNAGGGTKLCIYLCVFLALASAVYLILEYRNIFATQFIIGDLRLLYSENRSYVSKYAEVLAFLAPALYVIIVNNIRIQSASLMRVLNLSFFVPGIASLFLGARWRIVVLCLLWYFLKQCSTEKKVLQSPEAKNILRKLCIRCLLLTLVIYIGVLFAVRGLYTSDEKFLFEPGDMKLRETYQALYNATDGSVDFLYKISDYSCQQFAVFCKYYDQYISGIDKRYNGLYFLRTPGLILKGIGLAKTDINDAHKRGDIMGGMYSGFVYGFMVDFGLSFSLFVIFLNGILFSFIEYNSEKIRICRCLYPMVLTMVTCAPIYYFWHVGSIDVILFWFIILYVTLNLIHSMEFILQKCQLRIYGRFIKITK